MSKDCSSVSIKDAVILKYIFEELDIAFEDLIGSDSGVLEATVLLIR